jgi:hypothetical protein
MVLRMQDGSESEKNENIKKSIKYASDALSKDLADSKSWCNKIFSFSDVLGNSHLTNFFANNPTYEELNYALKAYTQSEKY